MYRNCIIGEEAGKKNGRKMERRKMR